MSLPLYDAHNHLQDEWLAPHWEKIAAQLPALGLRSAVVNGTHEGDWARVIELSQQHAWIRPSLGLHPWHVGNRGADWFEQLTALLASHPHAVIGEIGLDRWILDRAAPDDPRLADLRRAPLEEQLDVFSRQFALAATRDLPVTIHCLDAWGALHDFLRRAERPSRGFLLHAYGGPVEMVASFSSLGAYFSFNGSFLAENRHEKLDTFRRVPPDRLLIETDAPAMPVPHAWRTHKLPSAADGSTVNHPGNIEAAYTGLAAFLGMSPQSLADAVEENFLRFFGAQHS